MNILVEGSQVEFQQSDRQELEHYRKWIPQILAVVKQAEQGEIDSRITGYVDSGEVEEQGLLAELIYAFNGTLDRTDSYVREVDATLEHASNGKFHRHLVTKGMVGRYLQSAKNINKATETMREQAAKIQAAKNHRESLTGEFELSVKEVVTMVAAFKSIDKSVSRSANIVATAVEKSQNATVKISELEAASRSIDDVIKAIKKIAGQTNLLALNATIEAARVGELGKGFAVVANEVKELAQQTAEATTKVTREVASIQESTVGAVSAIKAIANTIKEVSRITSDISTAVTSQLKATDSIAESVTQAGQSAAVVVSSVGEVPDAASGTGNAANELLGASLELPMHSEGLGASVEDFLSAIRT